MGVGRRGDQLVIDFRLMLPDGRRVRAVEYEGTDTAANKKRVNIKWRSIQYHQSNNSFSYLDFFPHGSKAKHFVEASTVITFSDWWQRWIASKSLRVSTETNYQSQYEAYFKDHFGSTPLGAIDQYAILVFRKKLEEKLRPNSVNTYMKPLCQCLLAAQRQQLIDSYPCMGIRALKESRPLIEPLSFDELRHLLAVWAKKDLAVHDLLFFMAHTGVRPGEMMALKWAQVDFFNSKVSITANMQPTGILGEPKTEHSIRDIDLRAPVTEALRRQQLRTGLAGSFVWTDPLGRCWRHFVLRAKFAHWMRVAQLKPRAPKHMRHTYATLNIAAGESITWVSKMLGHSNVTITLTKYNRFVPNLTREDGSAFEKLLGNDITKQGVK